MKQAVISSILTTFDDAGSGKPTFIFLHGWGTDHNSLRPVADKLASKHRVVLLDLPGFGGSQAPPEDWHVSDYAEYVAEFIRSKVSGEYVLIGHSFGGRVILRGVGAGLLRPTEVVLIASAGVAERSGNNNLYSIVAKLGKLVFALPGLKRFQSSARRRLYGQIGNTDYLNSGAMKQVFVNTINEDLSKYATQISAPTLLIWGDQDSETPIAEGQKLHGLITKSQLEVLPGLGHFCFQQEPDKVVEIIKDFLKP